MSESEEYSKEIERNRVAQQWLRSHATELDTTERLYEECLAGNLEPMMCSELLCMFSHLPLSAKIVVQYMCNTDRLDGGKLLQEMERIYTLNGIAHQVRCSSETRPVRNRMLRYVMEVWRTGEIDIYMAIGYETDIHYMTEEHVTDPSLFREWHAKNIAWGGDMDGLIDAWQGAA